MENADNTAHMSMEQQQIEVGIKVSEDKYLPRYAHEGDAGMDLVARIEGGEIQIPPGTSRVIPTGVWLELPAGYEAQIRSRSGLAAKQALSVLNSPGTIDSGYTGEVCVILFNHDPLNLIVIEDGMRVAQMVVMPVPKVVWKQVDNLTATERGDHGFGSTGTKTT